MSSTFLYIISNVASSFFVEIHTGCYKIIDCFGNSRTFDRTPFLQRFSILTVIEKWGDIYQLYVGYITFFLIKKVYNFCNF